MLGRECHNCFVGAPRGDLVAEVASGVVAILRHERHQRQKRPGSVRVSRRGRRLPAERVVFIRGRESAGIGDGLQVAITVVAEHRHRCQERTTAVGIGLRFFRLSPGVVVFVERRMSRVDKRRTERISNHGEIAAAVVAGADHGAGRSPVGGRAGLCHSPPECVVGVGRRGAGAVGYRNDAAAAVVADLLAGAVRVERRHLPIAGVVEIPGDAPGGVGLGDEIAGRVIGCERKGAVHANALQPPLHFVKSAAGRSPIPEIRARQIAREIVAELGGERRQRPGRAVGIGGCVFCLSPQCVEVGGGDDTVSVGLRSEITAIVIVRQLAHRGHVRYQVLHRRDDLPAGVIGEPGRDPAGGCCRGRKSTLVSGILRLEIQPARAVVVGARCEKSGRVVIELREHMVIGIIRIVVGRDGIDVVKGACRVAVNGRATGTIGHRDNLARGVVVECLDHPVGIRPRRFKPARIPG